MASEKIKIRLQGHEKFVLREGWLNKGIAQVKNNPTVFLGKEGPDVMLADGEYKRAYESLCQRFPEEAVEHAKNGKLNPEEEILFNNVEIKCIKSGEEIFTSSDGDICDYFIIKENTLNDEENVRKLQEYELKRLYYMAHPEELQIACETLKSWGIY